MEAPVDLDFGDTETASEIAEILANLGPIADRLGNRAAVAQYEADIGDPARTRAGTSFAGSTGPLPRLMPMRDIVQISFNIFEMLSSDAILQRLANSARLPTDDNLTNCFPYAPTLRTALEMGIRYSGAALPWFHPRMAVSGGELHMIFQPVTSLGRIEALSTELALAATHRIVETFVGQQVADARVHFALQLTSDPATRASRFACPVIVGGEASYMAIPLAWGEQPSPYFDAVLWQEGAARCEADIQALNDPPLASRVRAHVAAGLDRGRVVTIAETAQALGLSSRSLVRAISQINTTHHSIVDSERRDRARLLLAQSRLSVADIVERLGFPDQSSFGRKCRSWFGESPARFRRQLTAPPQTA